MGALAVAALVSSATLVRADEKKLALNSELAHYFKVRASLAEDKLDGVKESARKLAKSDDKDTKKAAEELAQAKEIAYARKAFGDLSKVLIDRVEAATKKGERIRQVFIFDCSMTKPYGKWMQESKDIGNPYQGSKMPRCGKLLGTKGDEKCRDGCCDDEKKEDHNGDDHGHHEHE
jgi:Cu(I)/Ag(I) efflux system membrane fusion protein